MNARIAASLGELPDNEPDDHAAPERRQIIASVPDSAFERVLTQVAFERARADKLEMALREAHLACCQGDRERACEVLMGALRT